MKKQNNSISESDLTIYMLAIVHKCYEFFEMYGMFCEYSKCKKCGNDNRLQFILMKEMIGSFGGLDGIKIPSEKEVKQISRDIIIWKGLARASKSDGSISFLIEEYAKKYSLSLDGVYKIRKRVQETVDKFSEMKKLVRKHRRKRATTS